MIFNIIIKRVVYIQPQAIAGVVILPLIFLWTSIFFFSVNNSVFIDANLLCLSLAWKTRKTTHLSLLSTQKKSKASAYFAGTNLKRWHCLFLAWKDA